MRSRKYILTAVFGVLAALGATIAHSETKIGVANVQQAILQSESGKKLVEQINANFAEQDEALKERQTEITALLEKLKKDTELMSEQEFQALLNEITQKRSELAQVFQQLNRLRTEQIERETIRAPPITPDQVFPGLTRAQSLAPPMAFPIKNAPISAPQIKTRRMRINVSAFW